MNGTTGSAKRTLEQELAPHVEQKWAHDFIVELRLRGTSGDVLGAALTEVDAYCADSGEPAAEAFGDPREYARRLDLPAEARSTRPGTLARVLIPTVVQIAGFLALMRGAANYRQGDPVPLSVGDIVLGSFFLVFIAVLVWQAGPITRFLVRHPVAAWLSFAGLVVLMGFPLFLWQQTVVELPMPAVILVGAGLLVVGTVWELARLRGNVAANEITRPLEQPEDVARRRRFGLRMGYFRILIFPVIGGLLLGTLMLTG